MEKLDLPTEEKPEPLQQSAIHLHVPDKIEIGFKDPITLGFQLGCGVFVMTLSAGVLLFLAVLVFDI